LERAEALRRVAAFGVGRFKDGKIVEAWEEWDEYGMRQQLC